MQGIKTYLMCVVVIIIMHLGFVSGQFLYCNWVNGRNCTSYHHSEICGTDGVSYPNMCFFAKSYCRDKNIHIRHEGHCNGADPDPGQIAVTTVQPAIFNGENAVQDFFCYQLSHVECGSHREELCASDHRTYINPCEYEKQRCTHQTLHVLYFGLCLVSR
ncbi:hypothetical protein ACJMK2_010991 [Sinanodonta woodiana]|uniref:Kazal-like domain-containing protein n=1 Tax=Sinanodonta woodiana TaxID=1069815 RepID=A0ABD3V3G9_SINWO